MSSKETNRNWKFATKPMNNLCMVNQYDTHICHGINHLVQKKKQTEITVKKTLALLALKDSVACLAVFYQSRLVPSALGKSK